MSLLHAEYLKLSRRRLYYMMVIILAALVGLLAFFLLIFAQIAPELAEDVPLLRKPIAYIFGAQQVAGQTWFPLILAVVMLGSEFGSTVWATALTRDPRRVGQISARFVVLALASLLAITAGIAGWSIVTAIAVPGEGGPSVDEWLNLVWKVGLIELAWTAIGLGAVAHAPIGRACDRRRPRPVLHRPDPRPMGTLGNRVPVGGQQRPFPDRHPRRVRCIRPRDRPVPASRGDGHVGLDCSRSVPHLVGSSPPRCLIGPHKAAISSSTAERTGAGRVKMLR